jgi:hypothetical protein
VTDQIFLIVRSAVNLAREEEIKSVEALRSRLKENFPGLHDECDTAISAWAKFSKTHQF